MKPKQLAQYLDKFLEIKSIKDYSKNGLQVDCRQDIKKIGFSVDSCMEVFEKAKQQGCDMVLLHHGLKWRIDKRHRVYVPFIKKGKTF